MNTGNPVDSYPRSFRTHSNSDDAFPISADSYPNSNDSYSKLSPFICTQRLLDSCHIECKYCSSMHCALATCVSFRVLLGIVRSCEFMNNER